MYIVSVLTAYSVHLSARRSLKEMCRNVTDFICFMTVLRVSLESYGKLVTQSLFVKLGDFITRWSIKTDTTGF